ncbi:MAG: glycosyltransferase family A protein [Chloroflexota bacterium]|nr:glycosyltransferase family A protein [Chloroflexota bacterium]MDE2919559.1 glycosyltransferase family A protein [Chloroflexota bacterium]
MLPASESVGQINPRVSFIVPAYNEAHRVAAILDSMDRQTYLSVELVFVDDGSTDGTLQRLVRVGSVRAVRTIRHPVPRGVAAARNSGARAAEGDILVFMDADLTLPDDFADRILAHFGAGADYMLVGSRVADRSRAASRYLQSEHELALTEPELQRSSQAFSVRRHVYQDVGPFREDLPRGDDSEFGERVMAAGFRRVEDQNIEVLHDRPRTWSGFLALQRRRGRNFAYSRRNRRGHGVVHLLAAALARTGLTVAEIASLAAPLHRAAQLTARSPHGRADLASFVLLDASARGARAVGVWQGVHEVLTGTYRPR